MIDLSPDWRAVGACRTADPDIFFPVAVGTPVAARQVARAQLICAGCAVRQQCLDFAMRTRETAGIWGGTTPEERIRVHRARHRRPGRRPRPDMAETRAS
jgi:WhiB family redox-sensing transcriptional regulator